MVKAHAGIDNGRPFDWGRTASDYAVFRDIYPPAFFDHILETGVFVEGKKGLDIGTGTGVLPRALSEIGMEWTGADVCAEQIAEAERLSGGMHIQYLVQDAENLDLPGNSFDVVTACQCFWYFDHMRLASKLAHLLKAGGSFLVLSMAWLPFEDEIAAASEKLVLQFNPDWSGNGLKMKPLTIPSAYSPYFALIWHDEFRLPVHFSREQWHGRMRACRGTGATLAPKDLQRWECEHRKLLKRLAPEEFDVQHFATLALLRVKK